MNNTRETQTAFLSLFAGVAVGVGIALLLKSKSGEVVQKKIGGVTDDAVRIMKSAAREAQFTMSRETDPDAHRYEGGDSFV
ncbi:MAG: YtxH domain-containing protein [Nitrospira sp.]|nr:YtxH domain-containing protein [Nitrospira sp.]